MSNARAPSRLGPAGAPSHRVLHVGCGPARADKLHPIFRRSGWRETRLDIDPAVRPDIAADITAMPAVASASHEAIWCSHCLEHLDDHRVRAALGEFRRVLTPDGFALVTSPDLQRVAQLVADGREEEVAYVSPAGEIRAMDMLFGFRQAIAGGNFFMRHHTGFSAKRLGAMMREAGFAETRVAPGRSFDLWAVGFQPHADRRSIVASLLAAGIDLRAPSAHDDRALTSAADARARGRG